MYTISKYMLTYLIIFIHISKVLGLRISVNWYIFTYSFLTVLISNWIMLVVESTTALNFSNIYKIIAWICKVKQKAIDFLFHLDLIFRSVLIKIISQGLALSDDTY